MTELPKNYDPQTVEAEAYRTWVDEGCFTADPSATGESYCIVIPPPNVTGALHLGHAINNTLQDILIRRARMQGKNTLWIPGIDHAGIATQAVVEKQLKEKENKTRHDVGREGLVERIWAWKQQYGDRIINQLQRLGCSCDWTRTRFTLDDMCAKAVRETFFKLFKDGLIYRGKRLVNWDVHLQTSISDDELYDEPVKTSLWSIRYPIDGTDQHMIVATTRPETMLADTAVAVHPDDARWNWAIGKQVRLPLTDRLIPIIGDPILVDMTFGSGCVKVTPAHDPNDYAVWQRQNSAIEIKNLMTPDGRVNDADPSWGKYTGLKFADARKKVVEDLLAGGYLTDADIKPHEANVKFSDRSKTAIQPYLSDQWFVKMAPLAEPALEVVRDGTIKFSPERYAQQYLAWLGEKRDWPISRQLWWGHRIPVWSGDPTTLGIRFMREDTFDTVLTHPSTIKTDSFEFRTSFSMHGVQLAIQVTSLESKVTSFVAVPPGFADVEKELTRKGFTQDPDVLDTWFSSALWPHSTLGWPESTADLAKYYPTSVLLTGRDIITLWVARMVMMGMYNMGGTDARGTGYQPVSSSLTADHGQVAHATNTGIPFAHVVINPTILDGKGERMSKSKGNGVDPIEIIDGYGADALRFTLTTMATETQEVRMAVKKDAAGRNTSEKFDFGRNFANKLWNASRFVLSTLQSAGVPQQAVSADTSHSIAGLWILSRFNRALVDAEAALSSYRFDLYAKACYDFFWRDLCDWYLETVKVELKNPQLSAAACQVLASLLDGTLRLMHPVVPFITETIWWKLNDVAPVRGVPGRLVCPPSLRLVRAPWPEVGDFSEAAEFIFPRFQEIVQSIRNLRSEYKVDPKKPVAVSIAAPGDSARQLNENSAMIESLAICTLKEVRADLSPLPDAARALAAGCEIYVEGLIDPNAERDRIAKRVAELTKLQASLEARESNESYMAKAPAALVQQTKDQLKDIRAELEKLRTV